MLWKLAAQFPRWVVLFRNPQLRHCSGSPNRRYQPENKDGKLEGTDVVVILYAVDKLISLGELICKQLHPSVDTTKLDGVENWRTCESQSRPGIEIWLEARDPRVQGTVVEMEQVSKSQFFCGLPLLSFLAVAAAATRASGKRYWKNSQKGWMKILVVPSFSHSRSIEGAWWDLSWSSWELVEFIDHLDWWTAEGQGKGGAGMVACPLSLRGFKTINAVPSEWSMYSLSSFPYCRLGRTQQVRVFLRPTTCLRSGGGWGGLWRGWCSWGSAPVKNLGSATMSYSSMWASSSSFCNTYALFWKRKIECFKKDCRYGIFKYWVVNAYTMSHLETWGFV